jgi:hypothetical protein
MHGDLAWLRQHGGRRQCLNPLRAGEFNRGFKQGRKVESRVLATLSSLARIGFIAVMDNGRGFAIRREA